MPAIKATDAIAKLTAMRDFHRGVLIKATAKLAEVAPRDKPGDPGASLAALASAFHAGIKAEESLRVFDSVLKAIDEATGVPFAEVVRLLAAEASRFMGDAIDSAAILSHASIKDRGVVVFAAESALVQTRGNIFGGPVGLALIFEDWIAQGIDDDRGEAQPAQPFPGTKADPVAAFAFGPTGLDPSRN